MTVVYPQEAPNSELLIEHVREASAILEPFRLRLGDVACFERPFGHGHTLDDGVIHLGRLPVPLGRRLGPVATQLGDECPLLRVLDGVYRIADRPYRT